MGRQDVSLLNYDTPKPVHPLRNKGFMLFVIMGLFTLLGCWNIGQEKSKQGGYKVEFINNLKEGYITHSIIMGNGVVESPNLEDSRKELVSRFSHWFIPSLLLLTPTPVLAGNQDKVEEIRSGFEQLLDIFTALAEPVLWFYALTACIMIATKNKDSGFNRLKQVAYAYAAIALLPTFFALLRWVSDIIKGAITF